MSVLHFWAVGMGLAAAALPVLIHWLTRPRPVRMPLSTLKFVREAIRQRRARHHLRDWLVLLARTAAVLLFAGAIARPFFAVHGAAARDEGASAVRIVLVDASQSMAAGDRGIASIERARAAAAEHLEGRSGLRANLIVAAARPRAVFDQPSSNFAALKEELAACRALPQGLNVQAALVAAAEMFAKSPAAASARREAVIVSDFQRSQWAAANFAVFPEDVQIVLKSAAGAETPGNLAVTRVAWQGRVSAGRPAVLEVEAANYSATPRDAAVQVEVGREVHRLEGHCPPFSRTTLSATVVLREVGWQTGVVRLLDVQDALESDNVRPLAVRVQAPPRYALISRQPASERPSSSYYLERALSATSALRQRESGEVVRLEPSRLAADSLATVDLIVLDHPGALTAEAASLLAAIVRRGRPLLYVAAESADAGNLAALGKSAGADVQLPVDFFPAPAGQVRRGLFLTEMRKEQSPFSVFGDSLSGVASGLRFAGGLSSRIRDDALADDVLAAYNDGSASLALGACGAGTIAVWNADLGQSNLPVSAAFVPLVGELVERLLTQAAATSEFRSGEPLAVDLPAEASPAASLAMAAAVDAQDMEHELKDEAAGAVWRMPAAGPPGAYRIVRGEETVFAATAAVPAEESDLRPLPAEVFEQRLAGGRRLVYESAGASGGERDDLWTWALAACMICLIVELLTLRAFRT